MIGNMEPMHCLHGYQADNHAAHERTYHRSVTQFEMCIRDSVGTIVALTPVAVGLAEKTGIDLPYMVAIVVGGSFFGDGQEAKAAKKSYRELEKM